MAQNDENQRILPLHTGSEFTLDDTYDYLKDVHNELDEKMKKLMINMDDGDKNNMQTLLPHLATEPDYIERQEQKLMQELLKHDYKYDVRIDPIPNTVDAYKSVVWELEQEIIDTQKMFDALKAEILNLKKNIKCLENNKCAIEKMKETCQNAIERNISGGVIENEDISYTKNLFFDVKRDLASTVEMLFPEHKELKDILQELTLAYTNGAGDDIYVDVNTKYVDCVKFMVEADIVTYHRNDKNKIRLVDLL